MGLIQRAIEKAGIPTIGISIARTYTEKVKPPRTIFLRWPFGHPLGEPFNFNQQAAVMQQALSALYTIEIPGTIVDVGYKWRHTYYPQAAWLKKPAKQNF